MLPCIFISEIFIHTYIEVPSERTPYVGGDHPGDEEAEEADFKADLHGVVGVHGESARDDEDANRDGDHDHGQGEDAELRRSKKYVLQYTILGYLCNYSEGFLADSHQNHSRFQAERLHNLNRFATKCCKTHNILSRHRNCI